VRRLALAFVLALLVPAASGAERATRSLTPYSGLGAWVSIYDGRAWRDPEQTVQTLAAHHVHTLFLETDNYRQKVDLVHPDLMGRFVDAAHAADLQVVAWYLPSLANLSVDLRRAQAALTFTSPDGGRFDSFALDVEATVVRRFALRNQRALALARAVRTAAPATMAVGAIVIGPIGNSPSYWPSFPYAGLSRLTDVFLPMAYFTQRAHGAAGVRGYTTATVRTIRLQIAKPSFPIHLVGGLSNRATAAELRAFVQTATSCGTIGGSLWEYGLTKPAQWTQLQPFALVRTPPSNPGPC
jgi:hypothetical protein